MNNTPWNGIPIRYVMSILLVIMAFTIQTPDLKYSSVEAAARSGGLFGPACGAAVPDGNVGSAEWSSASKQTFQMTSPNSAVPLTATLYVMNSGHYLYIGITINDDEFSASGTWLPHGDGFRIDFDNDHSGALFALRDDALNINAGIPQFEDNYLYNVPNHSTTSDLNGGGTSDGFGAASRSGNLNHFELRHPLCSGDPLDFCLHPTDTVGFRLEYLDAQGDGSFGGSQFFPGPNDTSVAGIVIGQCSKPDLYIYLPLIKKK